MSSNSSTNNNTSDEDEGSDELWWNVEDEQSEEEEEECEELSEAELDLFTAVKRNDIASVQRALRNGAKVNCRSSGRYRTSPLMEACNLGYDAIVRILLNAGADPWWRNSRKQSAVEKAVEQGHLSTVEVLINHDNGLLEIRGSFEMTPLLCAIHYDQPEIVHFLLDRGANFLATNVIGMTSLMFACCHGADMAIVRRLLAAGVAVEARDKDQSNALHLAVDCGSIEVVRELVVEHNANMLAVTVSGGTPFDMVRSSYSASEIYAFLIERYSNMLTHEHGVSLHAVMAAAEYLHVEEWEYHPPLNPLRIRLPLGKLTLQHFRTLLSTLDPELIRNRDESGKLPIHIACRNNAPVEVLALIVEQDIATLHMTDDTGALPLHDCCSGAVDDSSVRFLVEQGGVGTLAACNHHGALPLHILCGSSNPSLRTVQYMIHSFSGSVAAQTNSGEYPFMLAARESSTASLSVVYELVRTNAVLVVENVVKSIAAGRPAGKHWADAAAAASGEWRVDYIILLRNTNG